MANTAFGRSFHRHPGEIAQVGCVAPYNDYVAVNNQYPTPGQTPLSHP